MAALTVAGALLVTMAAGCVRGEQPGRDDAASEPPARLRGRLAYVKGADIYVQEVGQPSVRVTTDYKNLAPVWSPDGQWLMWVKRDGELARLWVARADGSGARPVDGDAQIPPFWTGFSWAPDSKSVAYFVLDGTGHVVELRVAPMGADGPGTPRTVYHSDGGVVSAAWSPDSRELAVSSGSNRPGSPEQARIVVMPAAGGEPFEILRWPRQPLPDSPVPGGLVMILHGLTWSPDGAWLTMFALPQNEDQIDRGVGLYLASPATAMVGNPQEQVDPLGAARPLGLMQAHPQWVGWSPDGKRLAAVIGEGTSAVQGKQLVIFTPSATASQQQVLTPAGVVDRDPAWSPDGSRLAVSRARPGANFDPNDTHGEIWILDPTAQTEWAITRSGSASNWWPRWSADGKGVVWLNLDGNKASIQWAPADGTGQVETLVTEVDMPPEFFGTLFADAVMAWFSEP